MNVKSSLSAGQRLALETLLIFLAFLAFDTFIFADWLHKLYPVEDEFSMLVMSGASPLQWFRDGYANYFTVFPEFTLPYTNFIRPVDVGVYRLFLPWAVSGYKLQLVIINYGIHAAIAAAVYMISCSLKENSRKFSLGLALAAFFTPAFWGTPMPIFPSFAFDGMAALFCLVGIFLLVTKGYWIGLLILLLAIFTKETAIPIIGAVMIYSLLARRRLYLVVLGLELLVWTGIRFFAFGESGGAFLFRDISLFSWAYRAVSWFFLPVGHTSVAEIKDLVFDRIVDGGLFFYFANIIIWVLLFVLVKKSCLRLFPIKNNKRFEFDSSSPDKNLQVLFFLGAIFSAAYFSLIVGETRFSYVFLVCFLGLLSATPPDIKERRYILVLLVVTSCLASLLAVDKLATNKKLYEMKYRASRNLAEELRKHESLHRPVFIVNDFFSGFSGEASVAKFAGVEEGEFFRGSSIEIENCQPEETRGITTNVENTGTDETNVTVILPECARFVFYGADPALMLADLDGVHLKRNDDISYSLPDLTLRGLPEIYGPERIKDYGGTMKISINKAAVIYFDFDKQEWVYFP